VTIWNIFYREDKSIYSLSSDHSWLAPCRFVQTNHRVFLICDIIYVISDLPEVDGTALLEFDCWGRGSSRKKGRYQRSVADTLVKMDADEDRH